MDDNNNAPPPPYYKFKANVFVERKIFSCADASSSNSPFLCVGVALNASGSFYVHRVTTTADALRMRLVSSEMRLLPYSARATKNTFHFAVYTQRILVYVQNI